MQRLTRSPEVKTVWKDWGFERWFVNGEYCGKRLHIYSGCSFSMHFHIQKEETFIINEGQVLMDIINADATREQYTLLPGDVFHITPGLMHSCMAINGDADIIEVSTHHDDSDSYRVVRGIGRTVTSG